MSKYLRDIALWMPPGEEAKRWALSTNFLETLYLDSLPRLETGGVAKVVVTPCAKLPDEPLRLMINPDVLQLSKVFDFKAYWNSEKEERKHMALNFLQEGLLEVAKAKGWNAKPLCAAYNAILEKKLINNRPWSKLISSPDKKMNAQAWCHYDSDKADVYIIVRQSGDVISKDHIATVEPGDIFIRDIIGKLEWKSKNKIKLTSKNGKKSWEVRITNNRQHDGMNLRANQ